MSGVFPTTITNRWSERGSFCESRIYFHYHKQAHCRLLQLIADPYYTATTMAVPTRETVKEREKETGENVQRISISAVPTTETVKEREKKTGENMQRNSISDVDKEFPIWIFYYLGFCGIMPFLFLMATVSYVTTTIVESRYPMVESISFWRNLGTVLGATTACICAQKRLKAFWSFALSTIGQAGGYLIEASVMGFLCFRGPGQASDRNVEHVLIRVMAAAVLIVGCGSAVLNSVALAFASALGNPKYTGAFSVGFGTAGIVGAGVTLIPSSKPLIIVYYLLSMTILVLAFVLGRCTFVQDVTLRKLLLGESSSSEENNLQAANLESGLERDLDSRVVVRRMNSATTAQEEQMPTLHFCGQHVETNVEASIRSSNVDVLTSSEGIIVDVAGSSDEEPLLARPSADVIRPHGSSGGPVPSVRSFWVVLLEIAPLVLAMFLNYVIQFIVYPTIIASMRVANPPTDPKEKQEWFTKICMALVPLCDVIGRFLPMWITANRTGNPPIVTVEGATSGAEGVSRGVSRGVSGGVAGGDEEAPQPVMYPEENVGEAESFRAEGIAFRGVPNAPDGEQLAALEDARLSLVGTIADEPVRETNCGRRFVHLFHRKWVILSVVVARGVVFLPFFFLLQRVGPGQKEATSGVSRFISNCMTVQFLLIILFFIIGGWVCTLIMQQGPALVKTAEEKAVVGHALTLSMVIGLLFGSMVVPLVDDVRKFVAVILVAEWSSSR